MKQECEIVKDLLFSYQDGVLSESSKNFVDEHLKNCENCRKALDDIQHDFTKNKEVKEIDYFKKVHQMMNHKKTLIFVISLLLILVATGNIALFSNYSNDASQVEIYLETGISNETRETIKNHLENENRIQEIQYFSPEDELNQMRENLQDNAYLLDNYTTENNIFPEKFIVKVEPKHIENVSNVVQNLDGVKKVHSISAENPYAWLWEKCVTKFLEIRSHFVAPHCRGD